MRHRVLLQMARSVVMCEAELRKERRNRWWCSSPRANEEVDKDETVCLPLREAKGRADHYVVSNQSKFTSLSVSRCLLLMRICTLPQVHLTDVLYLELLVLALITHLYVVLPLISVSYFPSIFPLYNEIKCLVFKILYLLYPVNLIFHTIADFILDRYYSFFYLSPLYAIALAVSM